MKLPWRCFFGWHAWFPGIELMGIRVRHYIHCARCDAEHTTKFSRWCPEEKKNGQV